MPLEFHNLFSLNKLGYIKGDRPKVECILCAIIGHNDDVVNLLVCEREHTVVSVNKFPYNSGHVLLCPKRHITDIRELTGEEEEELGSLARTSLDVLEELYSPSGYNVGFNIGDFAGASLPHLHIHVIPRYRNEVGFIDIVAGAKILIEDPMETMSRLREAFKEREGC
jgi:ATP adenylyltransferase